MSLLLLDTCALIWIAQDAAMVASAKLAIREAATRGELFVSPEGGAWQSSGRFAADGDRLMLTLPNGDKRVYERL